MRDPQKARQIAYVIQTVRGLQEKITSSYVARVRELQETNQIQDLTKVIDLQEANQFPHQSERH